MVAASALAVMVAASALAVMSGTTASGSGALASLLVDLPEPAPRAGETGAGCRTQEVETSQLLVVKE